MEARDFTFTAIAVGDSASFERRISVADVDTFASLSGDANPLHMDDAYARTTPFGQRIVHGMFLGALVSQLVGMHLPGKRCLYLSQTLTFKQPAFIGDIVRVTGTVAAKSPATQTLTIAVVIAKGEAEIVRGESVVKMLS